MLFTKKIIIRSSVSIATIEHSIPIIDPSAGAESGNTVTVAMSGSVVAVVDRGVDGCWVHVVSCIILLLTMANVDELKQNVLLLIWLTPHLATIIGASEPANTRASMVVILFV